MELYAVLGLKRKASKKDIKKAYKKKARETHPDVSPDSKEFVNINKAYSVLSDPVKKISYDKYGKEGDDSNEQARGLVISIVEEMVRIKLDKPIEFFRRKIDEMERNIKEGIKQKEREIVTIQKFMDRAISIDSFIMEHFNTRVDVLKDVIKGYTYELKVTGMAYDLLKHYEFKRIKKEDFDMIPTITFRTGGYMEI